jgi:hypothetical protein
LWLVHGDLGVQWGAWLLVLAWGLFVFVTQVILPGTSGGSLALMTAVVPFGFLFKALFALQACRFFAEGRRNGALELLLCTPLTNREIVMGQTYALWRAFVWPLLGFFGVLFAPLGWRFLVALVTGDRAPAFEAVSSSVLEGVYCVCMLADLVAVGWFGMWLALAMKRPQFAAPAVILWVLVIPSVFCVLSLLVDLLLLAWAMTCLEQYDFRQVLARNYDVPAHAGVARSLPSSEGLAIKLRQ